MLDIVGIDETGRGSWAGPLVVGAVILKTNVSGLKDSKKLSKINRHKLSQIIKQNSFNSLGWVSAKEIDRLGLTKATTLAIERALVKISYKYSKIIIDGHINYLKSNPLSSCIIRADEIIKEVSAASILAKVERDLYMLNIAKLYPTYNFENNAGYGTSSHILSLKKHGICSEHRLSFKPIKILL